MNDKKIEEVVIKIKEIAVRCKDEYGNITYELMEQDIIDIAKELTAIDSEEAIITEKKEKIVEYKFEIIKRDEPLIPFLNEQSKEGWEVVQFETRIQNIEGKTGITGFPQTEAVNQILFKRPKAIQRVEREVTDEEIEKWIKTRHFTGSGQNDYAAALKDGMRIGAKAMRDNKIK